MDWHPPSFGDFGDASSHYYESQHTYQPHWQSSLPSPDWRSRHDRRDDPVTPLNLEVAVDCRPTEKPAIAPNQIISSQTCFLPTPRSSLELTPKGQFSERLREVLHNLQPLLKGEKRELTIKNVNEETFSELYEAAQDDLPGWENLRIDFASFPGKLYIHYPLMGHEIINSLFSQINALEYWPTSYQGSTIHVGGSADVKLLDGVKSPDYSFYEKGETPSKLKTQLSPTVVWEVGYSESARKLTQDCARHICGSRAEVLLAIAVDFQHLPRKEGEPRQLKSVTCAFWELDDLQELDRWAGDLNVLERCDGGDDHGNTVPTPGTRYMMVSDTPDHGRFVKYVAAQTEVFKILPADDETADRDLCIQYRHLYREPKRPDIYKTAIKIPFSTFRKVIKDHEDFQREMDQQLEDGAQKRKRSRSPVAFNEHHARSKRRLADSKRKRP